MSLPPMVPVASSNVASIGHDPATGELHVAFKSGSGRYVYSGVPEATFHGALDAESVGRFISEHVKGRFPHVKADAGLP